MDETLRMQRKCALHVGSRVTCHNNFHGTSILPVLLRREVAHDSLQQKDRYRLFGPIIIINTITLNLGHPFSIFDHMSANQTAYPPHRKVLRSSLLIAIFTAVSSLETTQNTSPFFDEHACSGRSPSIVIQMARPIEARKSHVSGILTRPGDEANLQIALSPADSYVGNFCRLRFEHSALVWYR
jgi:hypothetical protein